MQFSIPICKFFCILFKLFENGLPIDVGMLYIAISSSVVVHEVDADVIALLDVGEQIVSGVNRVVLNLEVGEGLNVEDLYFHVGRGDLFDEEFLSGV